MPQSSDDLKQIDVAALPTAGKGLTLGIDGHLPDGLVTSVPPGAMTMYIAATAPTGWLICDGSAVSRTTFSKLFAIVSTTYGAGDGSTTFNIPDLQGRMPVGLGTNATVSTLGNNDGVAVANRRPKHRHTAHNHVTNANVASTAAVAAGTEIPVLVGTGGSRTGTTDTADGGSGTAADSLDSPAYLVVSYIIKT